MPNGDFTALFREALAGLKTGGKTLQASLQEIEEGKRQAIGRGQQALVTGGLAGTTMMGGVPIQAEKVAATQRLGARGQAERTYLTTLASFAAFAQRGAEAKAEREAAMERLQTQIGAQERAAALSRRPTITAGAYKSTAEVAREQRAARPARMPTMPDWISGGKQVPIEHGLTGQRKMGQVGGAWNLDLTAMKRLRSQTSQVGLPDIGKLFLAGAM